MTREIFLSGMTADQLSEMIRESLRDELRQLHPEPSAETPNYLTRRETARRLRISLVTLNDWVNRGRIRAHKIGGRVLFRDSDVEAALHRIPSKADSHEDDLRLHRHPGVSPPPRAATPPRNRHPWHVPLAAAQGAHPQFQRPLRQGALVRLRAG